MKAWVAQKVNDGYAVNCIDDDGKVCLHLGGTEYRPMVVSLDVANALVDKQNAAEVKQLVAAHKERAAQIAALELSPDTYIPVTFSE